MTWRTFWFERETGRLRCWWRALLFLAVAMALTLVLVMFLALPLLASTTAQTLREMPPEFERQLLLISLLAMVIAFVLAGIWALRIFEHLPAYTLGITTRGPWLLTLIAAALGGTLAVAILAGMLRVTGLATIHLHPMALHDSEQWLTLAGILCLMILWQALMLHGYLFQTLLRGIGPLPALLVVAALGTLLLGFGGKQPPTPIVLAYMLAFYTLLGMVYLRGGSLWAPIGFWTGWQLSIFCLSPSTQGFGSGVATPITIALTGPAWLTGGSYGPEGGAVASILILGLLAGVAYTRLGLPLASRWWEWRDLSATRTPTQAWDFSIGTRYYQWKLLARDQAE